MDQSSEAGTGLAGPARPKVLYLGGTGRSGSTLLARLLGSVPGYAPVGELRYIWERGFEENHLCECGLAFHECPFWRAVVARAYGGFDGVDVAAFRRELRVVDRIRHAPELLAPRLRSARLRRHLAGCAAVLEPLYTSAATVSGRAIVVDSSKDPSYAFVLHALGRIDLAVVHLVRDSRAVAYSWTRTKRRPEIPGRDESMMRLSPIASSVAWDVYNALFELFERTHRPFVRVRYEDLVERPAEVVATVAALHGVPGHAGAGAVGAELGHSISGNPMRFDRGPVQVRIDDEWIDALSARDRRIVTAATAPLLKRYGYRIASTRK